MVIALFRYSLLNRFFGAIKPEFTVKCTDGVYSQIIVSSNHRLRKPSRNIRSRGGWRCSGTKFGVPMLQVKEPFFSAFN